MSRRARRKYTPEQKADAVRMVQEVGNLSQVARDLELTLGEHPKAASREQLKPGQ
jgi:transposase-like protein